MNTRSPSVLYITVLCEISHFSILNNMMLNWICFTNSFRNKTWLYRQVLVAVICNLSAVIVGNSVSWLGPFGSQLMSTSSPIPMSSHAYSWIVSVMEIADGVMAIPAGLLIDRWGRKQVLLWTAPITLTSWILVAISNTVFSLYLCRLMQGAVESLVLTAAPIYIAEISSSNIRGAFQLTRAIQAEFFPSHTRATGGALTGLLASLQLFIILKIYLPIKHLFGLYMNFLIYTLLNFIFTILMIKYIPESAGKTMGEINKNMMEISKQN